METMLWIYLACQSGPAASPTSNRASTDADADGGADSHADEPEDSGQNGAPDSGAGPNGDSAEDTGTRDMDRVVRFIALGDGGEGNSTQYQVADAVKAVCDIQGCDFALYLGDNIYYTGPDSVDDVQFEDKFELPYAEVNFPFYVILGNHDYGGNGAGYEFWKDQYEIEYTLHSEKWTMPDNYYAFDAGPTQFFGLDTTAMYWGFYQDQLSWIQEHLATSSARWKFGYGHHPYISNGPHGNAGEYDGWDEMPISNGDGVKEFMDSTVCGQLDVYFCGHDHSMQWLESTCGTEFIVSGAAAKTTHLDGENPTHFESDVPGFLWVEIDGNTFRGQFWDEDGNMVYEKEIVKAE